MIVNILGSTKNEIHFGCKALSHGLENVLKEKLDTQNNIYFEHLQNGYKSPGFHNSFIKEIEIKEREKIVKAAKYLLFNKPIGKSVNYIKQFDYSNWLNSIEAIKRDSYINKKILISDLNVINVEGIVHDKAINGLFLLALSKVIASLGKKVIFVNVSMMNENEQILKDALNGFSIPTRESETYNYLESMGLKVVEAFDTSIAAPFTINKVPSIPNHVLITGSVNKDVKITEIVKTLRSLGKNPVYIPSGISDFEDLNLIKSMGVKFVDFGEINYLEIPDFIKQFEFVVSGRYHLDILSFVAGVPFIPLKSNTWKIQGLVDFFDLKNIYNKPLEDSLNIFLGDYKKYKESILDNRILAKKLVNNNMVDL